MYILYSAKCFLCNESSHGISTTSAWYVRMNFLQYKQQAKCGANVFLRGEGTLRKIWRRCCALLPKPLPYLRPKSVSFSPHSQIYTLFQPCLLISYQALTNVRGIGRAFVVGLVDNSEKRSLFQKYLIHD